MKKCTLTKIVVGFTILLKNSLLLIASKFHKYFLRYGK